MPREIFGRSTAADWTSKCIDDSVGPGTWPRTVLCSYSAAANKLTVAGVSSLSIVDTTSLGAQGTRYILST
jgi:hypothetical protein